MPYASNAELPAAVRDRYSDRCQTVWRTVFNDELKRHNDEGRAFATANSAGQRCKESTKMTSAVKYVDGSDNIIEGLAIPYGGPLAGKDRHGEDFGPDTDLALDWFPEEGRPVLYQHGLDDTLKTTLAGRQIEREAMDDGQWVKVQLDRRNRHKAQLDELIDQGALSFSSGAPPHLVQTRKDGHIIRWPWVELSLTPTPANDWAGVYAVKTAEAIEHIAAARVTIPAALKDALDEAPGTEPDLDRLIEAATAEMDNLIEQARRNAANRVKDGRALSAANRGRLTDLLEQIDTINEKAEAIRELLASNDPAAHKALEVEWLRYQQTVAQQAGMH